MSRSIVFCGHDFGGCTTAEARVAPAMPVPVTLAGPGIAGEVPVSSAPGAREIEVRLFLDLDEDADAGSLHEIRREMSGWLSGTGRLVLPGVTGGSFRDVVLADASLWGSLFEDGSCTLLFEALDPRFHVGTVTSWGMPGSSTVGGMNDGSVPAAPEITFTASAGASVTVALEGSSEAVEVVREFEGGESVSVDCAAERVLVDGVAADEYVTTGSTFFLLPPGSFEISVTGGHNPVASFEKSWL
ncbi:phage distal tail protein [Collinsella ihumii]|uniref:phage distal tail protein n=1 Tax=Collinsella ihumii TaxID=1720204 RepID=UPI0025AAC4E0|nr:phage tail protein [Collinsella ihumii]MDN0056360.1 phage tail protein [Collinsella ihumii]